MATTDEGTQLTLRHRRIQLQLAALTAAEMRALWGLLDPDDLEGTMPVWLAAARQTISNRRDASAVLADRYYTQFSLAEVGTRPDITPIRPLNFDQVNTSLLVTGPFRLRAGSSSGINASAAAAVRHVLNGGRDTITQAVQSDDRALGWIRVTAFKPCAFCALLASRGPVYKTRGSASFQAHDACACHPEPVYSQETQWPDRSREWADLYSEVQSQPDPLNAFRQAYEI